MSFKKPEPTQRPGFWTSHYSFYYEAALLNLSELLTRDQLLEDTEAGLEAEGHEATYIQYSTRTDRHRAEALAVTVEVFCCMAVEAFLNFYGVVRLGEDFYTRNYERLGVTQKLETLLATCEQVLLSKNAEITKLVRKMFEKRNSLVHPKAKEIALDALHKLPPPQDIVIEAKQRVDEMKRFFELFIGYDSEAMPFLPSVANNDA